MPCHVGNNMRENRGNTWKPKMIERSNGNHDLITEGKKSVAVQRIEGETLNENITLPRGLDSERMKRYAELTGNCKKSEIKSFDDNTWLAMVGQKAKRKNRAPLYSNVRVNFGERNWNAKSENNTHANQIGSLETKASKHEQRLEIEAAMQNKISPRVTDIQHWMKR